MIASPTNKNKKSLLLCLLTILYPGSCVSHCRQYRFFIRTPRLRADTVRLYVRIKVKYFAPDSERPGVNVAHGPVHYKNETLTVRTGGDIADAGPQRILFTKRTRFTGEREYRVTARNDRLFYVLLMLRYLLRKTDAGNDWKKQCNRLLKPIAQDRRWRAAMGLPEDWTVHPVWQ